MMPRHAYGHVRDDKDVRDLRFSAPGWWRRLTLPASANRRPWLPEIWDQGQIGSCVWHALIADLLHEARQQELTVAMLSRLYGYFNTRVLEGTADSDSGCQIRNAIKVSLAGLPLETLWPYDTAKVYTFPPDDLSLRSFLKGIEYRRVAPQIDDYRAAIAGGDCVVFGMALYESFESDGVASSGVVTVPDIARESMVGGHAMLACGYSDVGGDGLLKRHFLVRNSWGTGWGQSGYCQVPYEMIPQFCSDAWVITRVRE